MSTDEGEGEGGGGWGGGGPADPLFEEMIQL